MSHWYVLPVLSQHELPIEKSIRALGYGAMAPWCEGQRRFGGLNRRWKFPLYTGYVFVSFPDHAEGWQHVSAQLNTLDRKKVFQLLGGDIPAILRPADVEYLRSIADGKYKPRTLVVGDVVLVPDGYLQGLPSTITRVRRAKRGKIATIRVKGEKNDMELDRPLAILAKV